MLVYLCFVKLYLFYCLLLSSFSVIVSVRAETICENKCNTTTYVNNQ